MSEKAKQTEEEFRFKCPSCKEGFIEIHKAIYEASDGDKILILKFECAICNYHKNDVIPLETKMKPGVMTLKVENESDLKSKIFRSAVAKLEIPELELEVNPGPSAKFYFTNVEGILDRFLMAANILNRDLDDDDKDKKEIEEVVNDLQKAINGELAFTLKITDPYGGSYIIPKDKSKYSFESLKTNQSENE